jgi:N-acyl-D-amino-acid deacylase
MRPSQSLITAILFGCVSVAVRADEPAGDPVKEAVNRGLHVVEKAARNYPHHRSCFSCHHQTLPMLAMVSTRGRGIKVDEELLQAQAEFSLDSFLERRAPMSEGKGIGGGAMTVGYGLWALSLAGRPRDEVTDAMVAFLLKTQRPQGHWPAGGGRRPPLEESHITCTVLAAVGLRAFAPAEEGDRAKTAIVQANAWLERAAIKNQEDRNARLWGLAQLDAKPAAIDAARDAVLKNQHDDGGWPARDDLESDAYATGQTLFVLQSAGISVRHLAYQRGVDFLLRTQQRDGSWKVESRAVPVQTFFDNGDPHGKHQFISIPATAWAVAGLAPVLGPNPPRAKEYPAPKSADREGR